MRTLAGLAKNWNLSQRFRAKSGFRALSSGILIITGFQGEQTEISLVRRPEQKNGLDDRHQE
jgi:hypothetical protein